MGLTLVPPTGVNPPILEELLLPDFKTDLRIDGTSEDALCVLMLAAARRYFEGRDGTLGRSFLTQTWDWTLDCWPGSTVATQNWPYPYTPAYVAKPLLVPLPPLQSVTSIKVRDSAGVVTTLDPSTYLVDIISEPGRITSTAGWWSQVTPGLLSPITIRFVAGYGMRVAQIPEPLRMALLATAGEMYTNRDTGATTVPPWVERLVASYRVLTAA